MQTWLKVLFNIAKAIPLIFILCIIGWSYYAYVIAFTFHVIPHGLIIEKFILLAVYHSILFMFLWAYAQCAFTNPVAPPRQFKLSASDWETLHDAAVSRQERSNYLHNLVRTRQLPIYSRAHPDVIRICQSCWLIKPDRAHHCSTCGQCVLKMDHHCPWVNNCIGYHNYKYFMQFLMYGATYCIYIGLSTMSYFFQFWQNGISSLEAEKFHVLFAFFAAWMFSLSLIGLGAYHIYLTMHNRTTLETFRAPLMPAAGPPGGGADGDDDGGGGGVAYLPDSRAYDVGASENFQQVCGYRYLLWLLPVQARQGTGLVFPTRESGGELLGNCVHSSSDSDLEAGVVN